jgi:hypothetical protein
MLCLKLSPSQDNNWYFCERQWYITYNLGYKSPGGRAANLGTCVHKIMEILALAKLQNQKTGEKKILIKDDTIGQYEFNTETWLDTRNSERKVGRSTYEVPGASVIDELHSLVYTYYSNLYSYQNWSDEDSKNTRRWVYTVINQNNGQYDVRRNNIVYPEQYLSYPIQEEWAKFDYGDGVVGHLTLTGIIDLIKCVNKEQAIYEIVDYKTGKRQDWSTGNEKTLENLPFDTQLMFYYYFLSKLYPHFKQILITIFYIKDGGPFTIPFEQSDLPRIEKHIKQTFEQIKSSSFPRMRDESQRDFKCRTFCPYFKMQLDGTNLCKAVGQRIKLHGIEKTTAELRQK